MSAVVCQNSPPPAYSEPEGHNLHSAPSAPMPTTPTFPKVRILDPHTVQYLSPPQPGSVPMVQMIPQNPTPYSNYGPVYMQQPNMPIQNVMYQQPGGYHHISPPMQQALFVPQNVAPPQAHQVMHAVPVQQAPSQETARLSTQTPRCDEEKPRTARERISSIASILGLCSPPAVVQPVPSVASAPAFTSPTPTLGTAPSVTPSPINIVVNSNTNTNGFAGGMRGSGGGAMVCPKCRSGVITRRQDKMRRIRIIYCAVACVPITCCLPLLCLFKNYVDTCAHCGKKYGHRGGKKAESANIVTL